MTTQRKIEIVVFLAVVVIAFSFLKGWILEREYRIRAEDASTASRQIQAAKDAAMKDRDSADQAYGRQMSTEAAAIVTPQQAAQVIVHYVPAPPAAPAAAGGAGVAAPPPPPPVVTVAKADLSASVKAQLPDAASYGIMTGDELQRIAKDELSCDADRHSLATCSSDKADLHTELDASHAETDAWKAAANGGTKFQRFLRIAKYSGCAGLGALGGAFAARPSTGLGAGIGAAAGVTACSIFLK